MLSPLKRSFIDLPSIVLEHCCVKGIRVDIIIKYEEMIVVSNIIHDFLYTKLPHTQHIFMRLNGKKNKRSVTTSKPSTGNN